MNKLNRLAVKSPLGTTVQRTASQQSSKPANKPPVAPPIYRPNATPKVLQTKKVVVGQKTGAPLKVAAAALRAGTPSRSIGPKPTLMPNRAINKGLVQAKLSGVVQRAAGGAPKMNFAAAARRGAEQPDPPPPARQPDPLGTSEELKAFILRQKAELEEIARAELVGVQDTICFMWKLGGQRKQAKSGGRLSKPERRQYGFAEDKETTCAEENLLVHYGQDNWVFSVSRDTQNGWKHACAGCGRILRGLRIGDLCDAMRAAP